MKDVRVAVVGLGYVGLPLAVAFSNKYPVVGFDVSCERVAWLRQGIDHTGEVDPDELRAENLTVTDRASDMKGADVFIVTVPTPIDEANRPDLTALLTACELVGQNLSRDALVVFESTVYPGLTEEICAPALERASGLRAGADFKLGYSPERINPGDKQRPFTKITKIIAGQDDESLEFLSDFYGSVVEAGIHRAGSIKVAEAAKVIENTQRDVNIALMNEISKICDLLGIRSSDVLSAAGTKWNFLKFQPGLVGGHCIGVDPYYLTAKAEQLGYHPEVILSGRRVNDGMGAYVALRIVKFLAASNLPIRNSRVGILGLTFKENVPDIRNSRVVDIYRELREFGITPLVHDPMASSEAVRRTYDVELSELESFRDLAAVVYAVPHEAYAGLTASKLGEMIASNGILADIKSKIDPQALRADVLHQAALGSVPRSLADPLTSHDVNVTGFVNLLDAARRGAVRRFIYAASSSTYGDSPELPKREDRIGAPLSPYAVTKLSNEIYAAVYAKSYGVRAIGLRYFNVFGPRQDPNGAYAAVIPRWTSAMIRDERITVNGDGLTSRDFCYVANAVQANIRAALAGDDVQGKVYNVAVGERTTLSELFELIRKHLSRHQVHYSLAPSTADFRPGDVRHSLADISKAQRELGYAPTHTVSDGLAAAVPWYLDFFAREPA